jgi:hypothetical protein
MFRILSRFGLPLLARELIEQAARKRTYAIRVLYALLLFCFTFVVFYNTLSLGIASPTAIMGRGREIFIVLIGLQFAGIYLFMPAMTCSVLTQEKERASLQLVFLTRLGPWTILFEKLMSRLVPMLGFLLLSLPLLAYAYTLGGISLEQLGTGVWLLVLTAFQLGAIALCCSAWFRTTGAAFIGSYLVTAFVALSPGLWIILLFLSNRGKGTTAFEQFLMGTGLFEDETQFFFPFCAAIHFLAAEQRRVMGSGPASISLWLGVVLRSVPILLSAAAALGLARVFLVSRAFLPPRNLLLNVFKWLDAVFVRINQNRLTKGVVLIADRTSLPRDEPIAWRETSKRSLGKSRYLLRLFIAIEFPVAFICILTAIAGASSGGEPLSYLLFVVWTLAVLMVAAQSAGLIAGERSHQTLDVLCTTPLSGREIIQQKLRAVRRLMVVLLIPFFTIFSFVCLMKWESGALGYTSYEDWSFGTYRTRQFDLTLYVGCSALSIGIYLPLVSWLSLLIGLKVRTQARAVIASLAAIVAWCVVPILLFTMPLEMLLIGPRWGRGPEAWREALIRFSALLSPATIIPFNEFNALNQLADWRWLPVIVNFVGYGACLVYFRRLCLTNADRLLGRVGADGSNARFRTRQPLDAAAAAPGTELQSTANARG